jgi:hypothetical protein
VSREIFLIVYNEKRAAPAHWSLFIPHQNGTMLGKIVQAVGSPFHGYDVEIKPNYNLAATRKLYEKILLANVKESSLGAIESKASEVPAPGVSPRPC